MAWLQRKPQPSAKIISTLVVDDTARTAVDILDGNENALTPVEGDALGKMVRLHPFSPVAIQLIRLYDREDADVQEVASLIGSDTTLATETLAYVNSTLFGFRETITSLRHAVTVLGADTTRGLATTLAMRAMLGSAPKTGVVRRIWKHSIATAVVASELAPIYGVNSGLANTAGVLHDVGRMGLLAQYGAMYSDLVLSLFGDVNAVLAEERQVCALDHCDVGFLLGKAWKLPEIFQDVAARHHCPDRSDNLQSLIHDSCILADTLGYSAVAYRAMTTTSGWVENSAPAAYRDQINAQLSAAGHRIIEKIEVLDF